MRPTSRTSRGSRPRQRSKSTKTRDLLLYVSVAIAVVAAAWMYGVHQARTGGSPNLRLKWIGFGGMTAVVFGYAIRACRRSWGKQRFWVLLCIFFAVHSGLGVLILMRVPAAPLLLYAVLTGPEYLLLAAYLALFLDSARG